MEADVPSPYYVPISTLIILGNDDPIPQKSLGA